MYIFERPKACLLISLLIWVHWLWAHQGIWLGLKEQKLSSSKQLCNFASCVGRGCNWGITWYFFGKARKSFWATHEFSFALNTASILGHHNSFLVSYHGKFPSGFAFFSYQVSGVHSDLVIFVFDILVSLSGFSVSVSVVVAAVVAVVGFENHNVLDVF